MAWTRGGLCTRRRARAPRRRARDERGVSLLEVQITVLVLGMVATAFCGSLFLATTTATRVESRTVADAQLRKYTELVRSVEYEPCANPTISTEPPTNAGSSSYNWSSTGAPLNTVGWVQNIEFGTPDLSNVNDLKIVWQARSASTCNSGDTTKDPGLQRVTLAIRVAGSPDTTLTAQVIKRTPNGVT